jgi:hypothetical protein
MPAKSLSSASIWKTLSNINVNEFTEEKGGLTYLSWSHAWRIMMENYPEMSVKWNGTTDENGVIRDVTYYEGGTAMVSCTVTIGEVQRECWLPVMDYRNKAIAHPSSRDISDAKQRCLVKCFSLYGLANYIYSGDALPEEEEVVAEKPAPKKKTKKKAKKVEAKPNGADADALAVSLKVRCRELHESGWTPDPDLQQDIKTAVSDLDATKMSSLLELLQVGGDIAQKLHDDNDQTEAFDD